ncbi:MAG TPA: N-acetylmuramoyl-L-alanine amidase [Candidatus Saccharimonadales bacterium]|nr:N-acetylmuramoyl-L-alanine amidase [Candidatus Saccharimonadales bacterium]
MSAARAAAAALLAAAAVCAAGVAGRGAAAVGAGSAPPTAEVRLAGGAARRVALRREGGADYVSAADLVRCLGAAREWNAELDKLTLRFGGHTVRFTVDTRWVQCDERVVQVDAPVLYRRNMVWVPVSALATALPEGSRMRWDAQARRLDPAPRGGPATGLVAGGAGGTAAPALPPASSAGAAGGSAAAPPAAPPGAAQAPAAPAPPPASAAAPSARRAGLPAGHVRVVLDAGHGGSDGGASGGGLREADVTLALVRALKTELERDPSVVVLLTRDMDREVPAERRAEAANLGGGALFVSLHADAGPPAVRGFEVLCWPPARVRPGPPTSLSPGGSGPGLIPWEDVAYRYSQASDSLARQIQAALTQVWPDGGRGVVHRRVLPVEGVAMPAVMVECGVLTYGPDAERLGTAPGQERLVLALAEGIRRQVGLADPAAPPASGAPAAPKPPRGAVSRTAAPAP